MARRASTVAVGLLLAVGLTGCASGSAQQVRPAGPSRSSSSSSSASPSGDLDAQVAHNRQLATDQARRLLVFAVIPSGAKELRNQPAGLSFPPLGMPSEQTYVDIARYYRVPLSMTEATAFVRSHPPAGLTEAGSSQGGSNQTVGYAWIGPSTGPAQGQLSMELAPAESSDSYLRVDAGQYWQDPRPIKDSTAGTRLRIEASGHCPASDYRVVGVRNPGIDLSRQLAPAAIATGGLLCSYSGANEPRLALLSARTLSPTEAGRLSRLAHQVDLSHSDGGIFNGGDDDGTAQVLVLDYPNQPAVDLWLHLRGYSSVSNGQVIAGGNASVAALLDATR